MNSDQSEDNIERLANSANSEDSKNNHPKIQATITIIDKNVVTPSTFPARQEHDGIEANVILNPTEQLALIHPQSKITGMGENMLLNDDIQIPTTSSNSNNGSKYYDIEIKAADDIPEQTRLAILNDIVTPSTSKATNEHEQIEIDVPENPTEQSPLLRSTSSANSKPENPAVNNCDACKALLATLLNFGMVIAGALNIDKCEVLKLIPIFLIVAGSVGLVLKPFVFLFRRCSPQAVSCFMCIISFMELGWMIFISYWVYSAQPDFDPANPSYCNKVAYYTAFWLLTIYWSTLGLGILCLCFACCVVGVFKATK